MTVPAPLRASRVLLSMKNARFRDVRVFGVVASTNDVAAKLAEGGAAPGLVVIAMGQTAGRGRQGRRWASPAGGLYLSALLPAPEPARALLLAGAAGVAAASAIRAITGAGAGIKWPNDVWVGGRKVGGVLIEVRGGESRTAIAGIGINVDAPSGVEIAEGAAEAGGLGGGTSREVLAAAVLDGLDEALGLADRDPAGLARRYRELDVLTGRVVRAETPGGLVEGRVVSVDLEQGVTLDAGGAARRLRPEHTHVVAVLPEGDPRGG